jgi:hypothetical protein
MINLTPIAKPIQERMFEKMSVLGRKEKYIGQPSKADELQLQDMATRTTFIRMTSGQENPVVMMGGELSDDKEMVVGFTDIYGPKTYTKTATSLTHTEATMASVRKRKEQVGFTPKGYNTKWMVAWEDYDNWKNGVSTTYTNPNFFKRPIPGIKSIDVQFKGGVRALRTANISWTCWTFEDLDRLRTHFLSHGKTVALEWGWVYNKKQFEHLQTLINSKGVIDEAGFVENRKRIFDEKGDFDFMVGVVKNFEYTTRDDGGFDCKTDLVSMGANVLDSTYGSADTTGGSTTKITAEDTEDPETKIEKIKEILAGNTQNLHLYDNRLSASAVLANLDVVLRGILYKTLKLGSSTNKTFIMENGNIKTSKKIQSSIEGLNEDTNVPALFYRTNQFIIQTSAKIWKGSGAAKNIKQVQLEDPQNIWVRWGWLEDNILSKFMSLVSADKEIVNDFRSIEVILDNNKVPKLTEDDKLEYESTKIRNHKYLQTVDINKYILPGSFEPFDVTVIANPEFVEKKGKKEKKVTLEGDTPYLLKLKTIVKEFRQFRINDNEGSLRNMLVNTKVLTKAFETAGSVTNLKSSFETMFNELNSDINMWKFAVTQDEINTRRLKIIDENITDYDFINFPKPVELRSKYDSQTKKVFVENETGRADTTGLFYFPVWQHNSIVKKQGITAKLPSSMQLAAMYGANINIVGSLGNADSSYTKEGTAAGALSSRAGEKDKYLDDLDYAFKHKNSKKIGNNKSNEVIILDDENQELTIKGGFDILKLKGRGHDAYVKDIIVSNVKKYLKGQIPSDETTENQEKFTGDFSGLPKGYDKYPIPLPEHFMAEDPAVFRTFLENNVNNDKLNAIYGGKFDSKGIMKSHFSETVYDLIQQHGIPKDKTDAILIPLELTLSVDGIGGIFPGNAYHSDYIPARYQEETLFQCFDVNHTVDSSGWTVNLGGKMRTTLAGLFDEEITSDDRLKEVIDAYSSGEVEEKHTELNARKNDPGLSAVPGEGEADIAYQGPV